MQHGETQISSYYLKCLRKSQFSEIGPNCYENLYSPSLVDRNVKKEKKYAIIRQWNI